MKKEKRLVIAIPYLLVIIIGCIGYFYDYKLFLAAVIGMVTVAGAVVLQALYGVFLSGDSDKGGAKSSFVFLALAVVLAIGAVVSYFTSKDVGIPGFCLGTALYCLQSFILTPRR